MHTAQNVFGIYTEYGTHPRPPTALSTRLRRIGHAARHAGSAVAVAGLAAWYMLRH